MQSVCEVVAVTPASAYRYERYILQTELPAPRLDGLEALLIDEKHLGRAGFVTLVLHARTGELPFDRLRASSLSRRLWLAQGRGKEALDGFFAKLSPGQKATIAAARPSASPRLSPPPPRLAHRPASLVPSASSVGIDRSGAYRAAVEAHLPGADIVFDKFHLIANLGGVIDKVRRRTQAQKDAEGRTLLKGQRYHSALSSWPKGNLLRNPDNLSPDGRRQLKLLLAANRDLSMVYLLKDAFKAVWTYTYRKSADKCLGNWIAMAMESGVGELKRFASGLAEVKEPFGPELMAEGQILNFCQHRITSARIEAFNTIVSRVIHKACGVANLDFLFLKLRQESLQR